MILKIELPVVTGLNPLNLSKDVYVPKLTILSLPLLTAVVFMSNAYGASATDYEKQLAILDAAYPEERCFNKGDFTSCKNAVLRAPNNEKIKYIQKMLSIARETKQLTQMNDTVVDCLSSFSYLPAPCAEAIGELKKLSNKDGTFYEYIVDEHSGKIDISKLQYVVDNLNEGIQDNNTWILLEYFKLTVNSIKDVAKFMTYVNKSSNVDKDKIYEKIRAIPDFGKNLTISNFSDSDEYKHFFRYIKDRYTTKLFTDGKNYGVVISIDGLAEVKSGSHYFNRELTLKDAADCTMSRKYTQVEEAGMLETFLSALTYLADRKIIKAREVDYKEYECHIPSKSKKQLELLLANSINGNNDKLNLSWTYKISTGFKNIYYTEEELEEMMKNSKLNSGKK